MTEMAETQQINVRIPKENIAPLTKMAKHLGVSLPTAMAMSMQAAVNRGYFDINRDVSPDFSAKQWDKIKAQEMLYQSNPESFEDIDDFAKEEGLI